MRPGGIDGRMGRVNDLGQPIGPAMDGWTPPPTPPREPMEGRFCRVEPLEPDRHAADVFTAHGLDPEGRNWTYLPYGPFATLEASIDTEWPALRNRFERWLDPANFDDAGNQRARLGRA